MTEETREIVPVDSGIEFMPVLTPQRAMQRYEQVRQCVRDVLRQDVDYGKIPGVEKPTLLKPGAEKLNTIFGLTSRFILVEQDEDWTGEHHNGEMFFRYVYRCQLFRGNLLLSECVGSCSSWESKYRYRKTERKCPTCGKEAIIKGKAEYGGGWLCWQKRGGCGAKFQANDPAIAHQETGRVPNPDMADQVNTISKMAQKRAYVGATLLAVNASDFFTQDVEDTYQGNGDHIDAEFTPVQESAPPVKQPARKQQQPATQPAARKREDEPVDVAAFREACAQHVENTKELDKLAEVMFGVTNLAKLTRKQGGEIFAQLRSQQPAAVAQQEDLTL